MVGNMIRKAGWAVAVAGVAVAGVSLAQGAAPDPNNAAAVKAWQASNNITEKVGANTWQAIAATPDGVLMRGVLTQRDAASGQATVGVRIEHFVPVAGGGINAASELDTFAVDCTAPNGGRMKQTLVSYYPQHNLGGDVKTVPATDDWGTIIDILGADVTAACKSSGGGSVASSGAARTPAPFKVSDDAAGKRWLQQQNIQQGGSASTPDWPLLGFSSDGAMFRSAKADTNKGTTAAPRYVVREEYYGPISMGSGKTALSESIDYDVNCDRSQVRRVSVSLFAARNLAGDSVTAPVPNAAFVPVANDPTMKEAFDDICAQAQNDLSNGAGKFQAKGFGGSTDTSPTGRGH